MKCRNLDIGYWIFNIGYWKFELKKVPIFNKQYPITNKNENYSIGRFGKSTFRGNECHPL